MFFNAYTYIQCCCVLDLISYRKEVYSALQARKRGTHCSSRDAEKDAKNNGGVSSPVMVLLFCFPGAKCASGSFKEVPFELLHILFPTSAIEEGVVNLDRMSTSPDLPVDMLLRS